MEIFLFATAVAAATAAATATTAAAATTTTTTAAAATCSTGAVFESEITKNSWMQKNIRKFFIKAIKAVPFFFLSRVSEVEWTQAEVQNRASPLIEGSASLNIGRVSSIICEVVADISKASFR